MPGKAAGGRLLRKPHNVSSEDIGIVSSEDIGIVSSEDIGIVSSEDIGIVSSEDFGIVSSEDIGILSHLNLNSHNMRAAQPRACRSSFH